MENKRKYTVMLINQPDMDSIKHNEIVKCHTNPKDTPYSIQDKLFLWDDCLKSKRYYYFKQHVFIISNEEINGKMISEGKAVFIKDKDAYYKVVASTMMEITPESWLNDDFKEIYIKRHNEGAPITEIELELVPEFTGHNELHPKNQVPKSNQDGSLIINKDNL